jgi:hypothetical protein
MDPKLSLEHVAHKVEANVNEDYAWVFLPTMYIMKDSVCGGPKVRSAFQKSPMSARIRQNKVRLEFPSDPKDAKPIDQVVYEAVKESLERTIATGDKSVDKVDHWFFVYHPENTWHDDFAARIMNSSLDRRFCGFSDQIDTVVLFMKQWRDRYSRKLLEEQQGL